jgi:hypothetical protein
VSKMIPKPMVRLTQTVHLSCTDTNTISKQTKTNFHMTHVTLEFHQVRPKRFLSLWYVRRNLCTYLASRLSLSRNGPNELPLEPRHLGAPSGASKIISKPLILLVQIMQLSCTNTNTVSKRSKMRFHITHITEEFHQVRPI